jgi:putative toxin-antitoxin system antitoxin component (TIGR02293 family)
MATVASVKHKAQPNHAAFMLLVPDKAGRSISVLPSSLDALAVIDLSRMGLGGEEAGRIANLLGVSDKEMARLLNQSVATFHRQAKVDRLDSVTTERLLLLAKLASYGITVFQDTDGPSHGGPSHSKFTRWLQRPLRILGDRSPIAIMDTTTGIQLVEDILGRIEYGVFS